MGHQRISAFSIVVRWRDVARPSLFVAAFIAGGIVLSLPHIQLNLPRYGSILMLCGAEERIQWHSALLVAGWFLIAAALCVVTLLASIYRMHGILGNFPNNEKLDKVRKKANNATIFALVTQSVFTFGTGALVAVAFFTPMTIEGFQTGVTILVYATPVLVLSLTAYDYWLRNIACDMEQEVFIVNPGIKDEDWQSVVKGYESIAHGKTLLSLVDLPVFISVVIVTLLKWLLTRICAPIQALGGHPGSGTGR